MKKTKIIIPALGLLLLSTAASVTGTVAWFSMNNSVSATGMNIQAKAEKGIVISNLTYASPATKPTWADTAVAPHAGPIAVLPTSTKDAEFWVHSKSNDADEANTGNPYSQLSLNYDHSLANGVATGTGAGWANTNGKEGFQPEVTPGVDNSNPADGDFDDEGDVKPIEADEMYYLKNSFYIKSSGEAMTKQTLYITHVYAKLAANAQTSNSADLDKALRVLIKSGSTVKICAPFAGASLQYDVCTAINGETPTLTETDAVSSAGTKGLIAAGDQPFLTNYTIPPYDETSGPTQIDIYIYFEGEDENCKSSNLAATLDQLEVEVKFGTKVANS